MASTRDEVFFKDLMFSGNPSEYRQFRRKILLNTAALEEKHIRLEGLKILTRVSGEAWRATEHLSIAELRAEAEDGWMRVLSVLDTHCRFLPEMELNECMDAFLFHLRRRQDEGRRPSRAGSSRFSAGFRPWSRRTKRRRPPGRRSVERRGGHSRLLPTSSDCSSMAPGDDLTEEKDVRPIRLPACRLLRQHRPVLAPRPRSAKGRWSRLHQGGRGPRQLLDDALRWSWATCT